MSLNLVDQDCEPRKRLVDGRIKKEEKRRKWEEKLESIDVRQRRDNEIEQLIQDRRYIVRITPSHVVAAKEHLEASDRMCGELTKLLYPYFQLHDSAQSRTDYSGSTRRVFVAEGTETIRLLIRQSVVSASSKLEPISIQSIFVKSSLFFEDPVNLFVEVEKVMNEMAKDKNGTKGTEKGCFRVLIAEEDVLSSVAGFPVSRGALACGFVPDRSEEWLMNYLQLALDRNGGCSLRLLALDGVCDTANLGAMIRTASAFRIDAVILSSHCCDPWYRRSIRVSMGHVFRVPCIRVDSLATTLGTLSETQFGVTCYAAVVDRHADMVLESTKPGMISSRWCCVMGNEASGISEPVREACEYSLRIGMDENVDSLSVSVATGILLHGLKEREAIVTKVTSLSLPC